MSKPESKFDAWHPGLSSDIPNRLLPQATIFRAENSEVSYAQAKEAAEFCGLKPKDLVAFKVERLLVHEVLIRVTADLSVPDGPNYEILGINLRAMAAKILNDYVMPNLPDISREFDVFKDRAAVRLGEILERDILSEPKNAAAENPGLWAKLTGKTKAKPQPIEPRELTAIEAWRNALTTEEDPFEKSCLNALSTVVGGIVGLRGRLMADQDMIVRFAVNMVANDFGSEFVGKLLTPYFAEAVTQENYRYLPAQSKPFFMNVKGASAAGKSTIRPEQRRLAQRMDIPWEDFALISPDYWRKLLLDYETMGDDFKYAAMLTGQELEIIDKKLDRYMASKAARQAIPHLLIDRFRFDSFDVGLDRQEFGQLLTRFGDTVFFFFIITPPAATVERAWKRGLETGRYKAVDDLLHHNIEAYTGMPNLFFAAVLSHDRRIHFEFLDNSVAYGQKPRTIAYGWNGSMTILDLERMNDIDLFKNVNIAADRPEDVLQEPGADKFSFLKDCLRRIPKVTLADPDTGKIYGETKEGEWVYKNKSAVDTSANAQFLGAIGWDAFQYQAKDERTLEIAVDTADTLGRWGAPDT